ncbi:hypothetical protein [Paludisphaera rhizosphaerae]|uniref:hypothetical protein n=1 Tax=Paludisphaera rhizosphaerae TaxID=2711216 RepID=UPI0013EC0BFE|nr:hypothetical protein [Paludisphaera rhizosphaerae]
MALRTRNAVLLAKIESTEGVDAAPAGSTDAVKVENLQLAPNTRLVTTNEHTGSLDGSAPLVGGTNVQVSFRTYLKGSGAAATPPEIGKLFKASGWAEQITAAAVPVAPEALASGASPSAATLGASASSTAQAYRGMPVAFTGAVQGNSVVADYSAAKLAGLTDTLGGNLTTTTSYQIPANVLYRPASVSIPSLTLYAYRDGLLYKMTGCRGTGVITMPSGEAPYVDWTFTGMLASKEDAAVPAAAFVNTVVPVYKNSAFKVDRRAEAIQQFTLDMGNQIVMPDNPNAKEAFDYAIITARQTAGSLNPQETLIADRDYFLDYRDGVRRQVHARVGTGVGNRIAVTVPAAQFSGYAPGDRDGLDVVELGFVAPDADAGAFVCFW